MYVCVRHLNCFSNYQSKRYELIKEDFVSISYMITRKTAFPKINFLVYNSAVVFIPIGIHKIIMNMGVFAVAILAWVWLGERLICFEVIAIFVAFSGVALTSRGKEPEDGA